jgi:NAD(P)-dependent dehydrogenase (short-subunit alcohol dehydrogenase family)
VKYDLVDRRCVVTGASTGIGKEIARNLAYFGATVVIASHDRERGSAALQEIVADSGNDRVSFMQVDVASRASIRAFVRNLTAGGSPVHVLVNNAAVIPAQRKLSPDGIELTWATNVLGYYAITAQLLPTLQRCAPARVVMLSSTYSRGLELDDVQFERRSYDGMDAYAQSKQADRMLTWRFAQLADAAAVGVHACHPGTIASELFRDQHGLRRVMMGLGRSLFMKTVCEGALTPTFVAADPSVDEQTGRFWIDRAPVPCKFARDEAMIAGLWKLCAEMAQCEP